MISSSAFFFVFVIVEVGSRRIVHYAVTRNPTDPWIDQQLRETTRFGQAPRFLIRDVGRKYGSRFTRVAKGTGLEVVRTPYQAPKANAICAARSRNTSATLPCPTTPGHRPVHPLPS